MSEPASSSSIGSSASGAEGPVLLVEDLSLQIKDHLVFEHISFMVEEGEIAVLIGPNGAGKTMLIRAVLDLTPYRTGRVEIFGRNHRELGDMRDRIGYMPQRLDFDRTFPMTVYEAMLLRLKKSGFWINRKARRETICTTLDKVRAGHLSERRIGRLSGGELQRVLLAYSLLSDPDLLFLDEPAAGVDVAGESTFYEIIHDLQRSHNITVVMVSHDLDVVYRYADQVLCLNRELLCRGAPGVVLQPDVLEQTYGNMSASYQHQH